MGENILVVDDDKLLLQTIKNLLEKEKYSVTAVDNSNKALELIKQNFYPLIILDVRMPDMDGMELLKRIRDIQENSHTSTIIVITGYADENVPIKAIKYGASDYIMKPFDITEFLYSVNKNMRIARLEMEKIKYMGEIANKNKELETALEELRKAKEKLEEYNCSLEQKVEERAKELNELQVQLFQSAKMAAIGQLGAGVAHELNNPLGGILGYAQFILEKFKKKDLKEDDIKACQKYIETIEKEAIRCKKIVENLLRFSRRPITFKKEPANINNIVEDTISLIHHQLKIKNINVITNFQPNLPKAPLVINQIQQVLTNLILNAQQAMPNGGELKISTSKLFNSEKIPSTYIKIEVTDTGVGIPEENLPKIFDPFFTTKDKEKGTGLGLSIAYQIIQEHRGNIEVKSKVGEGSTFTILIPVEEE
ncbi:MAG: response regulator [Candidatus Omnitrophica bacterium]|nr:response regulator [Candidatus Omnitrophota bacterium]